MQGLRMPNQGARPAWPQAAATGGAETQASPLASLTSLVPTPARSPAPREPKRWKLQDRGLRSEVKGLPQTDSPQRGEGTVLQAGDTPQS